MKWLKWVLLADALLVILLVGYVILFADFSANWPGVIALRKSYRSGVWKAKALVAPDKVYKEVQADESIKIVGQDENSGEYTYSVSGRFADIDIGKGVIYLKVDSQTYGFYAGQHRRGALAIPIKKISSVWNPEKQVYEVDTTDHLLMAADDLKYLEFLPQDSSMSLVFRDRRPLAEIKKSPDLILNLSAESIIQVSINENN